MPQRDLRYPRLGKLIARLTRSLVAQKDWDMEFTMDYVGRCTNYSPDTVYRWQQGRLHPRPETIETLLQIGKKEANLPREWGENLVKAAHLPDSTTIVDNLWGPKEIRSIPSNLPPPEHTELIGRQNEITRLLQLLSPQHSAHLISVDGIGGVGKTSLVLEVAYLCKRVSTREESNNNVPTFDAIIFVSAKQQYLTPDGILPRYEIQRTLHEIFREVAFTLNHFEITHARAEDQSARVREALSRQRTLLIVDNLETMEDKQEIVSFLYELPQSVKVVMTTRERALFSPIRLEQLAKEAALNLIKKETQEKEVNLSMENAVALYNSIGGIPAALVYAIGQVASGYSVESVLNRVAQASGDVARFCFEGSVGPIRGQHAHHLLMATAMFPKSPLRLAIVHAADLVSDPIAADEGIARLQRLSLVSQQEGRYRLLPLTREYALAELTANSDFEQVARERWIQWYLNFAEEYGGRDWKEWHIRYDRIEEEWENLLAVFDWCATHERYNEMRTFWKGGKGSVIHAASIYGYWDDQLTWTTWLIQAAERRGDWSTAVEVMVKKGYTLTLMGQLEEADRLLRRAWEFHELSVPRVQVNIAQNIARLRIHQGRFDDASTWLNRAQNLLEKAQLDEPEHTRRQIITRYTSGKICYNLQDYDQAEQCFRETVDLAQDVGWQRITIYARNYLADIAITQGRFDEAEQFLQTGLTISERNKDKRRVAFYKRSFTRFFKKQENVPLVFNWSQQALDDFESLGMPAEAKEMHEILAEIQIK